MAQRCPAPTGLELSGSPANAHRALPRAAPGSQAVRTHARIGHGLSPSLFRLVPVRCPPRRSRRGRCCRPALARRGPRAGQPFGPSTGQHSPQSRRPAELNHYAARQARVQEGSQQLRLRTDDQGRIVAHQLEHGLPGASSSGGFATAAGNVRLPSPSCRRCVPWMPRWSTPRSVVQLALAVSGRLVLHLPRSGILLRMWPSLARRVARPPPAAPHPLPPGVRAAYHNSSSQCRIHGPHGPPGRA